MTAQVILAEDMKLICWSPLTAHRAPPCRSSTAMPVSRTPRMRRRRVQLLQQHVDRGCGRQATSGVAQPSGLDRGDDAGGQVRLDIGTNQPAARQPRHQLRVRADGAPADEARQVRRRRRGQVAPGGVPLDVSAGQPAPGRQRPHHHVLARRHHLTSHRGIGTTDPELRQQFHFRRLEQPLAPRPGHVHTPHRLPRQLPVGNLAELRRLSRTHRRRSQQGHSGHRRNHHQQPLHPPLVSGEAPP